MSIRSLTRRALLILFVLAGLGTGGWYLLARGMPGGREPAKPGEGNTAPSPVHVEVVHPSPGGLQRTCIQPGSVEPFEAAELYAKVSGYLVEQKVEVKGAKVDVDIGTRVKAGDVLARISVPEYEKQVERDTARVQEANAKVKQMEAHLKAAQAEARASDASVVFAKVLVRARTAFRTYREKQLNRIKELVASKAVDERLRDEQEDYYMSALEGGNAARRR